MMTINQFAERANLSPGTIRFYQSKGILLPACRLENGYRMYTDDQLQDAYLISSLRQADIGLEEIRSFLAADPQEREQYLQKWRQAVASKLLTLEVAHSYLQGMSADRRDVHLIQWEEEVQLLWFRHSVPGGPAPFAAAIRERRKQLQRAGGRLGPSSYVRVTGGDARSIEGEVGFRLEAGLHKQMKSLPPEARVELVSPSLFAALDCVFDDAYTGFQINRFLRDYGLESVGKSMERHVVGQEHSYLLMIPVRKRSKKP